jgi:ABC-2 type transport system ATP-binding protein
MGARWQRRGPHVAAGNVKVRFYVPEAVVGSLKNGQAITIRCDGCAAPVSAKITYVSNEAEFTPPVIYSNETRRKLVFLIEARPSTADAPKLRPGPARGGGAIMSGTANGNGELVIDVHGLNKRFGDKHVVNDLTMQVARGEIFGFLGPNGSGKTTSIRMMCGLLTPDSGTGTCLGYDHRVRRDQAQRGLHDAALLVLGRPVDPREPRLRRTRLRHAQPRDVVDRALEDLGLRRVPSNWRVAFRRMEAAPGAGRVPAARTAAAAARRTHCRRRPKARRDFWEQLHQLAARGISVLVSTHYMDEAERCHKLAYIAYGKLLAQGTSAEVVASQHLTTWSDRATTGRTVRRLQGKPGVDQTVAFGTALHVTGKDAQQLEQTLSKPALPISTSPKRRPAWKTCSST